MCMTIYLASDYELPESSPGEDSAISVRQLAGDDQAFQDLQEVTLKPYLYNVGSHCGCGCGFNFGFDYSSLENNEAWAKLNDEIKQCSIDNRRRMDVSGRESVEQLFDYIRRNLAYNQAIELYSYWTDQEGSEIEIDDIIYVDTYTLGDHFTFVENQCIRFFKVS